MHQFRYFFNTTRLPKPNQDIIDNHFKTRDEGSCPNHVVVMYKGNFHSFVPFADDNDVATPEQIEEALEAILDKSLKNAIPADENIGILSCADRESWRINFKALEERNPAEMKKLNSAICLVILSDLEPQTYSDQLKWTYINDTTDVWADKSLSFVSFKNGAIGSQSEVNDNKH